MPTTTILRACALALMGVAMALPVAAQVRLIDMVPNNRSGETNQDSEPTITVDPLNINRMAGSAFTWDNLTGGPMSTATAPIYVSRDRGASWTLAFIVPSAVGAGFPTGDITIAFGGSLSGAPAHMTWLYGGTLSSATAGRPMTVLRAQDAYSSTVMSTLDTQTGNVDQPHTVALTSAGKDKIYVGFNKGYGCIVANGRTSTIDSSQDADAPTPTLTTTTIEDRDTPCQDGFAQTPTAHADGTTYVAFIHDWSGSPRMTVVRDDNSGTGPNPFQGLTDPSDGKPGRFIVPAMILPSGLMGQNRLGASNVSIAVDPSDSDRVYVAWGDSGGANSETIHVRRSVNRGADWSNSDLLTVTNAMNPQIAISVVGTVGVLYQQVTSGKWETRFVRTTNAEGTTFDTPGMLLASQGASTPPVTFYPYIGDYASLISAGRNFVGMFSASNYPDKANFAKGVKYQREVDWKKHKLYSDAAHSIEVTPSIDPFFFEVRWNICSVIPRVCHYPFPICRWHPEGCYPIYDPWWKFKCPQCDIEVLINPGEERVIVDMYDDRGRLVDSFYRLRKPVVVRGVRYTYGLTMKAREGASYVLKAFARGAKLGGDFNPIHLVRKLSDG
jgi:hypothetical protein